MDWGTTSLRAFLIDGAGKVLDSIFTSQGVMQLEDRSFDAVFEDTLRPWLEHDAIGILASGMITSRNGWIETPYAKLPACADDLADAVVRHTTHSGRVVHFITGLVTEHDGAPDVMRGEETQIVGAIAAGCGDGRYVLPGTHSKWVSVRNGRIVQYQTYMTGEVYAALRAHTILGTLIAEGPFDDAGFARGVASGLSSGVALLHHLFHARTLPLFGKLSGQQVADFLSGLLIGSEIQSGTAALSADDRITLVGRGDLSDRYQRALTQAGWRCELAPEDIAARGHVEIARAAGLLT